jgi:pimeloyl-ACP methyl ester carboxylesterase
MELFPSNEFNIGIPRSVLFCHGNAQDIDEIAPLAKSLALSGYRVFLLEYAGYGTTQTQTFNAKPTTIMNTNINEITPITVLRDVIEAWHFLPNREQSILIGFSLGGGAICQLLRMLTLSEMPAQIVLLNTFFSLPDLVRDWLPFSFLPWIMQTQWHSKDGLQRYPGSIVVVSCDDDELIAPYHAENLTRHCISTQTVKHIRLKDGGHTSSIYFCFREWKQSLLSPLLTR